MLQITILMVGKTREGFIQEGLAFYQKRLKPLMQLNLKSVREEKEAGGLTPERLKSREGERLRAQVPAKAYVAGPGPEGQRINHRGLRRWLSQREELSRPLAFLIGGHWGLSEAVLTAADERLALSRLTMTHELARLILLEQLYRAMTIKMGHPYHV